MFTVADLEQAGQLLVQDGNHGANRPVGAEILKGERGIAHIRAADISADGHIDFAGAQQLAQGAYDRIRKGRARAGDTLLTHKGTVGLVARAPAGAEDFLCSPQTTFWRSLDPKVIDPGFLHHFLRSPLFQAQLSRRMHETDMAPYVSLTAQRSLSLMLPAIAQQRRIALVLGALDSKIEANRQACQRLLQTVIAATHVEVRKTSTDYRPLADILALHRVRATDPSAPYIGLDQMPRGSALLDQWKIVDAPSGQSYAFGEGDFLFGKLRPYFAKGGVALIDGRSSGEVLVLRPASPDLYAIGLAAITDDRFIQHCVAVSSGTRMPRSEWKDASRFMVDVPVDSPDVLSRLSETARHAVALVQALVAQTNRLVAIRDELLPKLVSGKIRMSEAYDLGETTTLMGSRSA